MISPASGKGSNSTAENMLAVLLAKETTEEKKREKKRERERKEKKKNPSGPCALSLFGLL